MGQCGINVGVVARDKGERLGLVDSLRAVAEAHDVLPFQLAKHSAQVVCVWAVVMPDELQLQGFPGGLKEVHELLDLDDRGSLERRLLIPAHHREERRAATCQGGDGSVVDHFRSRGCPGWGVDPHFDAIEVT